MKKLEVNISHLKKSDQKAIRQVVYSLGPAATVRNVRELLVMGRPMTIFLTLLTFVVLLGLGALFIPFAIIAPIAFIVVPSRIRNENAIWQALLPELHDDDIVALS